MNKYFTLLIISVLQLSTSCNSNNSTHDSTTETSTTTGIKFFEGTFKEAQFKAKNEKKMIFMDAYASWCGPCKMLKANTFPDSLVGKIFNEKFISVAYDMEVGEGLELSSKYPIEAYPTLLFLDSDGKIVKNALGYRDPAGLIELANEVLQN